MRTLLRKVTCFAAPLAALYAGSNALSPNLSAVALALAPSLSSTSLGGVVSLATWLPASGAAILFGFAADASGRRGVLLACLIVVGDAALLATAAVRSLATLLLLRGIYGFALGGVLPLSFSCLGDWVGPHWRPLMVSTLTVSTAAGTLAGQVTSGLLAAHRGWRAPFLLLGAVALGLSWMPLLAGTGQRGGHEPTAELKGSDVAGEAAVEEGQGVVDSQGKAHPPPPLAVEEPRVHALILSWSHVRQLLTVPSNAIVYAATFPACLPWSVLGVFAVDYVSVDRGMGLRVASYALFIFGIGSFLGAMCIIALFSALRRRPGGVSLVGPLLGGTLGLGILPITVIIQGGYSPAHPGLLYGVCFIAGLLCFAHIPGMRAVLLNVNPPRSRGSAVALYALLDLLGRGVGPAVIAQLSESRGRREAFLTAVYVWIGPVVLLFGLSFTLVRDEQRMLQRDEVLVKDDPPAASPDEAELVLNEDAPACAEEETA